MSKRLKLRTAPTLRLNHDLRIDRENNIIRDVVAMQAGVEAIGHGVQADLKTLHMMARLGNARGERGIKQHFGHIGMSENAMGKQIGVARHFRVDGDKLRHDMYLLPSARLSPVFSRDPLEYLFDMAERHPADFGESVVIDADFVWTLSDGREVPQYAHDDDEEAYGSKVIRDSDGRPLDATTPLPVIRPRAFIYCDVVADGALTQGGLFGADVLARMFDGTSSAYANEVFDLVDRWREEYNIPLEEVPRKVNRLVSTYIFARSHEEKDMARKPNKKFEAEVPAVAPDTAPDEKPAEDAVAPEVEDKLDDELDDELDAALETAEETERRQQEPVDEAEAEPVGEEVSTEERSLAAAFKRIEQLEAENAAWSVRFEKLLRLTVQNTRNIEALDRNVRRIDGDPVVTYSVPKAAPQGSLEPLQFEAPRPPRQALAAKPKHMTERFADPLLNADFDVDPELATFAAMVQRQKALQGVK